MKLLVSLFVFFSIQNLLAQIYINEIFPAPEPSQSEWIELYNPNENIIQLSGLYLTSRGKSIFIKDTINFGPNSFVVFAKDTIGFLKHLRCNFFIANLPTLHNDWDAITIRTSDSLLVDSVFYNSSLVRKGFSIERIDYSEPGYNLSNLTICSDSNQHTICRENSKKIENFKLLQDLEFADGNGVLTLINAGKNDLKTIGISANVIFRVENLEKDIDIFSYNLPVLKRKDSIKLEIPLKGFILETNADLIIKLIIQIIYDFSDSKVKKEIVFPLGIPRPFRNLLVNEFLFDVFTGCGEFIELTNTSNDTLSLRNWKIVNSSNKTIVFDVLSNVLNIPPNGYFVVFWDSTFFNCFEELKSKNYFYFSASNFALRNTGDKILLINPIGIVQDSLTFFPQWHKGKLTSYKQKSLEKMIPTASSFAAENWFTCVDPRGATPGELNSVSFEKEEKISIEIEPNPFSPTSSVNSTTRITYKLPYTQARINLKIFDLSGTEIYTLANNLISPSSGEFFWNGDTDFGIKAKAGGYVILLEAIDILSGKTITAKSTIAVGW